MECELIPLEIPGNDLHMIPNVVRGTLLPEFTLGIEAEGLPLPLEIPFAEHPVAISFNMLGPGGYQMQYQFAAWNEGCGGLASPVQFPKAQSGLAFRGDGKSLGFQIIDGAYWTLYLDLSQLSAVFSVVEGVAQVQFLAGTGNSMFKEMT